MSLSNKWKRVIAISLAVVIVIAAFAVIYPSLLKDAPVGHHASFGPKLIVQILNPPKTTGNETVSTTIQVDSVAPDAFGITGYNNLTIPSQSAGNNSYYMVLLNQTISNSTSELFLSPAFNTIAKEWISAFSTDTGFNMPSLTVNAYETVYSGDNVSIYSYYNNLPYNPKNVVMQNSTDYNATQLSQWFNGTQVNPDNYSTVSFDNYAMHLNLSFPSTPSQVLHVSSNSSRTAASQLFTPDQCSNFYYNETCYSTCNDVLSVNYTDSQDMHSPVILPVEAVHLSNGTYYGNSEIVFFASLTVFNGEIGLNSANAYESSSGQVSSTMSTSPSFEHVTNISGSASTNGSSVVTKSIAEKLGASSNQAQNYTTGIVGIANVTYEFTHYIRYTDKTTKEYEGVWNSNCEFSTVHLIKTTTVRIKKDGLGTQASIVNIASVNGIKMIAEDVPIEVNIIVHKLLETASNGSFVLNWEGSNNSYQAYNIWSNIYAYSNAASVIKDVSTALAVFSTSLELGLAISDTLAALKLNGADADTSEAAVVADATTLIAKSIALTGDVLDLFSTISFVAGSNADSLTSGFSSSSVVNGSNYSISYYESQYPVTFTVNGHTYSFYAPTDYLNATKIVDQ